MEGRNVLWDFIPDMGQLELVNVSAKGWIIDPDVHGLCDDTHDGMCLPPHNTEIILTNVMTRGVTMVTDWGRGPVAFLKPLPKGPWRFPYIFLITINLVTVKPVDYPTF